MTARYQFLPWVRQGAANAFRNQDNLAPVLSRSDGQPLGLFPVRLDINDATPVELTLSMFGPGDVTGIDPRVVIRTDPPAYSADFEPNFLVSVEFDPPHFAWLFTPAAAGGQGRLRPWLALVVVHAPGGEQGDAVRLSAGAGQPLPVLAAPASELPDLGDAWIWAHAQAVQPDENQSIEQILENLPQQNLSRLICPRRLEPSTRYLACLVPAFEAGRKAGLGIEVTQADQDRLSPAWERSAPGQVQLPVYYHWEFATGSGGDFESLARRLTGRPAPEGIGRRPLRVENQPFGLPDLGLLAMEGALSSTEDFTPPAVDAAFRQHLRDLLNLSASEPVVTPPVYGRWQASQPAIPQEADPPKWLGELNLDPAQRGSAGLGVRVVQLNQEQLVASAWDQLGDAPGVAQIEARLEVAVAVLGSVMRRRVQPMETGQLVQFLGPAQSRLRHAAADNPAPVTLRSSLAQQGLPASFSSAPFRRTLRPAGALARRVAMRRNVAAPGVLALASGDFLQSAADRLGTGVPPINPAPGASGWVTPELARSISLPSRLSAAQSRYRQAILAAQTYFDRFTGATRPAPPGPFAFTAVFKSSLVAELNPRQTASRRFFARLTSAAGAVSPPARPGESVIGGPSFPQPMYEALRDLSAEYILPGVGLIEADTVTLLNSNPRFIEAYMIGLNHEMASELLWREFPSDLRHTYFRTFWDMRSQPPGRLPQAFQQLPPIHTWDPASSLGDNFSSGGSQLVLLIRGELLQRYPDALIYALKARTISSLGTEEKFPLFRGRIEPDITFLGFDLTDEEARGSGAQMGWFFVIQEQPSAPRFGLDETRTQALSTWNDLAWSDLGTAPGAHLRLADLLVSPPPGPVWGFNSAHMAAILRQRPVRIAMHARHLLPPGQSAPPPPPPRPPRPPLPPIVPPVVTP